jgi:hypothetical protein
MNTLSRETVKESKNNYNEYNNLTDKIFTYALQNEELLTDFLTMAGFEYDNKTSSKNSKFFFAFSGQKTGSLNVFRDKRSDNFLYKDFAGEESGNIFTLLEKAGIKEGKILYLAENYQNYFNLSNSELEILRKETKLDKEEIYKLNKINQILSVAKKKSKKIKNIGNNFSGRKTYVLEPHFTKVKDINNIKSSYNKYYNAFPTLTNYLTKERKINLNTEVIAVKLKTITGLEDENGKPVLKKEEAGDNYKEKYIDAIAIPYGIFDRKKIEEIALKDINEFKTFLYKEGCEIRTTEKVFDNLKSYSKVNYNKIIKKSPTLFHSKSANNLLVFESIFDYYSSAHYFKKDANDVLIMNGASMDKILLNLLNQYNFKKDYKDVFIFQQNDEASKEMIIRMLSNETFSKYLKNDDIFLFSYKKGEEKFDINDLIKNNRILDKKDFINRLALVNKVVLEKLREEYREDNNKSALKKSFKRQEEYSPPTHKIKR